MTIPEIENDLIIYVEHDGRIVRTGLLGYYDPLLMTDLFYTSLSDLSIVDHTLPASSGSIIDNLPNGINAHKFDLIVN